MRRLFFVVVLGVVSISALVAQPAQAADRTPVCIISTTEDTVGTTFVYLLKEQLLASQGYTVVPACTEAWFVIDILTMAPDGANAAVQTVSAISLLVENTKGLNYFVTEWVAIMGRDKLASQATMLIAS